MKGLNRLCAFCLGGLLILSAGCTVVPGPRQGPVSVGVGVGIHVPVYPELVPVPGYPVYYAPRLSLNLFFYDGLYWVFENDNWYASSWYNGPWDLVQPIYVPIYVLRIPVRYYVRPPAYFRNWAPAAPPRWDERWGREWQQRRSDWNQREQRPMPPPAPLPNYQRPYAGKLYPRAVEQQESIRTREYRYEPREEVTRQQYQKERKRRQDPQ